MIKMKQIYKFCYRFLPLFFIGILSITELSAQSPRAICINEVLVENTDNILSPYNEYSAWIELYNSSAATVNIKGCFLTDDPQNLTKYKIPMSDIRTIIKPHQHVLFWADGQSKRGALHLPFTLKKGEKTIILFVDTNGTNILDQIEIPANLPMNHSLARIPDGNKQNEIDGRGIQIAKNPTPNANNLTLETNSKIDTLKKDDATGITMTITAMCVVFSGLLLLLFIFSLIGAFSIKIANPNKKTSTPSKKNPSLENNELFVAISLALTEELEEQHDEEVAILTIERSSIPSAWENKSLNQRKPIIRK